MGCAMTGTNACFLSGSALSTIDELKVQYIKILMHKLPAFSEMDDFLLPYWQWDVQLKYRPSSICEQIPVG